MDIIKKIDRFLVNEEFIDPDEILDIILAKKKTFWDKVSIHIKGDQDVVEINPFYFDYENISKKLMKRGLTKNEIGEVRSIFVEAYAKALDEVMKKYKYSYELTGKDDIRKDNFQLYNLPYDMKVRKEVIDKTIFYFNKFWIRYLRAGWKMKKGGVK
jgi:hypothetical protein